LFEKQIFVQPGSNWGMPNFMRISVGTAQDNAAFLEAMREIAGSG
jgi:histidinol-phosphate/aromatic aminotransferase/cobyric acid decarboxylase-like protein